MLNEKQLNKYWQLKLPIKDGEWWDGRPHEYSNLVKWRLSFTQKFAMNNLDYQQFGLKGHNGIDIGGRKGTPIVAPCRTYITYTTDSDRGYGFNVVSETDTKKINGDYYKLQFVFAHFDEIIAEPYKWYKEGDLLGYMDSTGFSTGHHLHFGIRPWYSKDGNSWEHMFKNTGYNGYINPEPFLPHIVWDWREVRDKTNYMNYDNKLIRNKDTGEFGWFYQNYLQTVKTTDKDRPTLLLISYIHRNNGGVTIDDKTWQKLPRKNF